MDMQNSSNCGMPIDRSMSDLVLNAGSNKIRRPPNAFMLFAREHRATVAKQHPEVANKAISTILGRIWKSTPCDVKEKYFEKSKMIGALHKSKYPDYVYSPREARLRKMNRNKKKDEVILSSQDICSEEIIKTTESRACSNKEDQMIETDHQLKSSPEYVPNNPGYFVSSSPEVLTEESQDIEMHNADPPEFAFHLRQQVEKSPNLNVDQEKAYPQASCARTECTRHDICSDESDCCSRSKLESNVRYSQRYGIPDTNSAHFPERHAFSYSSPPAFCGASGQFSGSMRSCCCGSQHCVTQVPRNCGSSYKPFWNSSVMNHRTPYFQGRDCTYDDVQHFPQPRSYHPGECYAPPFSYFDKPISTYYRGPRSNFYPQLNENWEDTRRLNNDFTPEGPERYPWFYYSNKYENVSPLYPHISRCEDEASTQNRTPRFDNENSECSPCASNLFAKSDTLNSPYYASSCCNGIRFLNIPENSRGWKNQPYTCSAEEKEPPSVSHLQKNQHSCKSYLDHNVTETPLSNSSSEKQLSQLGRVCDSDFVSLPLTETESTTRDVDEVDSTENRLNTSLHTSENDTSVELEDVGGPTQPFSLLKSEISMPYSINDNEYNVPSENIPVLKLNDHPQQSTDDNSQNNIKVEDKHNYSSHTVDSTSRDQIILQKKYNLNLEHEFIHYSLKSNEDSFIREPPISIQNQNKYDGTCPVVSTYDSDMIAFKSEIVNPNSLSVIELKKNSCENEKFDEKSHNQNYLYKLKREFDEKSTSSVTYNSGRVNEDRYNMLESSTSSYRELAEKVGNNNAANNSLFYPNSDNNIRFVRPSNFSEVYFRQSDGSTAVQHKLPDFNTLVSNERNNENARDNLVLDKTSVTNNSTGVILPEIKAESYENCN